jgi:hypothetical protein
MRATVTALLTILAVVPARAIDMTLDRRAIEQALDIAHSSVEANHFRFHADYRFTIAKAPVDFIEIVSPFRRLVLEAETSFSRGSRMFGQREALAALQPDPDRVEVYVEMTFHPLNTFIGVPDYHVELAPVGAPAPRLQPATVERLPRFGARLEATRYPFPYPYPVAPRTPNGSEPLLGGTIIARFDGSRIDPKGVYEVVVTDGKTELGRTWRIELAKLR